MLDGIIVSRLKIQLSIKSFSRLKSAGPDGIIPIMLQKSPGAVMGIIARIFKECLKIGYIPKIWREVGVHSQSRKD